MIKRTTGNYRKRAYQLYKEGFISEVTYKGLLETFDAWEQQAKDNSKGEIYNTKF